MILRLKRDLIEELDCHFGEQGFKRSSDRFYGDRYDRFISGGRQSIALCSHVRKPALVLDPAFASIRLDAVEKEVFRFEQKNELIGEHDVLQRGTIGIRLDKHEIFNTMIGRYEIIEADDCQRVGRRYASAMLRMAEGFWKLFPSSEAMLATLTQIPGKARAYAGTDFFAATRAIVLTKMLRGNTEARAFADGVLNRLSGEPKQELSKWTTAAFDEWARLIVSNEPSL